MLQSNGEVGIIGKSISACAKDDKGHDLSGSEKQLSVHNISPEFLSEASFEKKKEEIAGILHEIFSKYDC